MNVNSTETHLYQLNAYMNHLPNDKLNNCCQMMLLYPTVDSPVSADFTHDGHRICIRTINLNQPWQLIHQDLLALVA